MAYPRLNHALQVRATRALARDDQQLVDCPRCGGGVEFDEEGKPYTCYRCCDTGMVTRASADAERASASWAAHTAAEQRIAAGTWGKVRCRCDGWDDCGLCGNTGWRDPLPHITSRPRPAAQSLDLDDIPF